MIPYGRQEITEADISAVVDVLRSDFLTQGPVVPAFENKISKYCNVKNAVAVNSATSALHLACLSLGVTTDDIVWTSPITFVASANCALYCGAAIDFVDIDPKTYNICPKKLEKKLSEAENNGCLPKVVIPVHLAGQSCDMESIFNLSKKYGFHIVEDASHAIGGNYKNQKIGSCEYSDITVFSFHPVKIITTGEGGVAVTQSEELDSKMKLLRSHGITRNETEMNKKPDGDWYYQQIALGYNYRMTDIQAALGISQLERIDEFISARRSIAKIYDKELSKLPLDIPWQHPDTESAYHLYILRLKENEIKKSHKQVFAELRNLGVGVNLHYIPVYHHPYYKILGFNYGHCRESEAYYRNAISIPMYPGLSEEMLSQVIDAVTTVLST